MTLASPNRRILLVDDTASIHGDFRKILSRKAAAPGLDAAEAALFGQPLQTAGDAFELDSAHDGRAGAALVQAAADAGRPYAVAFVDMRMPGWDGVDTIEQIWRIDPQVQVVICTAYTDHPWDQVMTRLDVRDRLLVVKKPFDVVEVSQLARSLTAKWDATREAAQHIASLTQALAACAPARRRCASRTGSSRLSRNRCRTTCVRRSPPSARSASCWRASWMQRWPARPCTTCAGCRPMRPPASG